MPERKLSRLPRTAFQQMSQLPAETELDRVTSELHRQIFEVLISSNIHIINSASRTKTLERRMAKLERRGWDFPLPDIHGVRLILAKESIYPAKELILKKWPSPVLYWWGLPSFRDYSDPLMKGRFNRASLPEYEAVHLNIRINEGGKIAEVQIMTMEQFDVAEKSREEYLKHQQILY